MALDAFVAGGSVAFFGFVLALLVLRPSGSTGAVVGATGTTDSATGNPAVVAVFLLLFLVILAFVAKPG